MPGGIGPVMALQLSLLVAQMPGCLSLPPFPANCGGYPILRECPTQAPMFYFTSPCGPARPPLPTANATKPPPQSRTAPNATHPQ